MIEINQNPQITALFFQHERSKFLVTAISIAAEINGSILIHPGGEIRDVHRDFPFEINNAPFLTPYLRVNAGFAPTLPAKLDFRQFIRVLNPDAAMAEIPDFFGEQ